MNFNFLKMTRILLRQMDTSENNADIFTNIFTTTKLRYHFSAWSMMGVNRNNIHKRISMSNSTGTVKRVENCNFVEFVQNVSSPTVGVHGVAEARDEFAGAVFLVEVTGRYVSFCGCKHHLLDPEVVVTVQACGSTCNPESEAYVEGDERIGIEVGQIPPHPGL